MAAKRSKKKKSKSPVWWHWVIVAAGAFLLYQVLQRYLSPDHKPGPTKSVTIKSVKEKEKPSPAPHAPTPNPTPTPSGGPVQKWTFQSAARFLPQDAYPDNYSALPLDNGSSGILAYAKTLPNKKPGPQGLTNTQPGLRSVSWNGKSYDNRELDFETLKGVVGNVHFVGPPQLERKPWIANGEKVYATKLFLTDENRLVAAFLVLDSQGPRWATLLREDGKEEPAAFLQGTTAAVTRKVNKVDREGKNYIVVEKGSLDVAKPEAGYQWKVEAYAWNGKAFVFDKEYSATLTKEKKSEP